MKKYRIIERINGYKDTTYAIQKKSIFGFWRHSSYRLNGFDGHVEKHWHTSLEDAQIEFKAKTTPTKIRVVKTTENQ